MYDLCTRPEKPPEPGRPAADVDVDGTGGQGVTVGQPEPRARDTKMEDHGVTVANGAATNGDSVNKATPDADTSSPTVAVSAIHPAVPIKRLYEEVHGCEVGGFLKVGPGRRNVDTLVPRIP
ncbi:hypothetical protein DPEC_G00228250 [Dallia pectoralis]|uniref:Uncharacterized protein n=1 Tax=Dallia pectoralis TaxID=75939 RepID=A0ACC2G1H5_DALPE|nr:hypothetical protein DPEC_G00228250 [Dallia pectoralis]